MSEPKLSKLDISYKLDKSYNLSTLQSQSHQKVSWRFATPSFLLVICLVTISDSVTRVNDSCHDFGWIVLDSSHAEKNGDSTRLELRL